MRVGREGSFRLTAFLSFVYGFAGFTAVVHHFVADETYQHDALSNWLLAPLGAFCGFIVASTVHELAHFFTARFLGGFVRKIQLGSGALLETFRIMGTRCDVHESLRSGAVWYFLTSTKNARMKLATITGAAPLASIALAGVLTIFLVFLYPLTKPPFTFAFYVFPFLTGLTLPCVLFLPGILIPYRYQYAGRAMETDAMRLLSIPWISDEKIAAMVSAGVAATNSPGEFVVTAASLEDALKQVATSSKNEGALRTAIYFLRLEHDPRTPEYLRRLLDLPLSAPQRTEIIDEYVTCCLEWDAVAPRQKEINELSRELFDANPTNVSAKGTRGSALIDLGRIEEGRAILQEVLTKSDSPFDKLYSLVFLAIASRLEGELSHARDYALNAAKIDSASPVLKRISDLLPPDQRQKSQGQAGG